MPAHPSPSRARHPLMRFQRRLIRRLKVLFWQLRDRLQPPAIEPWPDEDQAYAEYEAPSHERRRRREQA
ncbi:hypothetical protein [Lamprobacter modestohalophilus]|uniref:hypothetical protein n=1 Tax=Lamprobacter modestohalophilus TaxID=1064514 RepID=UPI001905BE24|nr:hypothetical protein [Lamprobacter modestohalophilus]MCF7996204.1 hypothetical protein [Chromatiaceae bacterium]MCF8016408.1 hypothetical protein [Chromatiaceae bacterium]